MLGRPVQFSILIPTLTDRQAGFKRLVDKLARQVNENSLQDEVEILVFPDNRERTLGFKRNESMERASGEFLAFVDDDDVSDEYVRLIHLALRDHPLVDCVGITGLVCFRGAHPHRFVYSLQYDHYSSRVGYIQE